MPYKSDKPNTIYQAIAKLIKYLADAGATDEEIINYFNKGLDATIGEADDIIAACKERDRQRLQA